MNRSTTVTMNSISHPMTRNLGWPLLGLVLCSSPIGLSSCGDTSGSSYASAPEVLELTASSGAAEGGESVAELQSPLFASDLVGPGVQAREAIIDFGSVYSGEILEHTFLLSAVGTEDLVIQKIKPSCGCTVAESVVLEPDGTRRPYVLEEPLSPGTQLEVMCRFDTAGKRGPQVKPINIYCNIEAGVQRLNLKADLKEFFEVTPAALRLGRFSIIQSRSAKLVMRTVSGEAVKLSVDPLRIPAELAVVFEASEPDEAGRSNTWTVEVTLGGPTLLDGPYQFSIPIDSDVPNPNAPPDALPNQRWLGGTVLVMADVLDVYNYSPKQLVFGAIRPDTAVSRGFAFHSFDEEYPLEELVVEVIPKEGKTLQNRELYHTRVEPGNAPGTWRVEVLIDGLPSDAGMFEGLVRVHTNNPDRAQIEIPFAGIVR